MALQSQLFRGDPKLEAAAVSDPAHIFQGARGPHVGKIQTALIQIDGAAIAQDSVYGPETASAVRAFKQKRQILNFQGKIDDIVGKKTTVALDQEMLARERRGGGGLSLNFGLDDNGLDIPPDIITVPIRHVLIYFSGVLDDFGTGGLLLQGAHGQVVLTDMENLPPPKQGQLKSTVGFGGSLKTSRGVNQAFTFVQSLNDPRGKLIIYGFSAGGVNALDLCRDLNNRLPNVKVNLLVTVDVAAQQQTNTINRSVPANVLLNRNYFQTFPSLNGSRGAPATGPGVHQDIPFDDRFSLLELFPFRHGEMQKKTRADAVNDMRKALNAN
ncbi:MAG: peptidoglycan-binding protein [Planctomycetes bacterium]|nr:peptidoglycan-binding protein [Planctomycetota bacterium]